MTIAFDNSCKSYEYTTLKDYQKINDRLKAGGGTSFDAVFDEIRNKYKRKGYNQYQDCTIMFMTDGQTDKRKAINSLISLKLEFKALNIIDRYF